MNGYTSTKGVHYYKVRLDIQEWSYLIIAIVKWRWIITLTNINQSVEAIIKSYIFSVLYILKI